VAGDRDAASCRGQLAIERAYLFKKIGANKKGTVCLLMLQFKIKHKHINADTRNSR
jgi:type IV secretory pathway protease TraF